MQAAEIFHAHPEYFDWEAQRFILADKSRTALEFEQVRYVSSVQDSKELVEGAMQVEILGKTYPVKAEVARLEGLSAHAGQDFLLRISCWSTPWRSRSR